MDETIIRFLCDVEREDDVGSTWTFKAGELEDHVSRLEDGIAWLNFG